MAEGLATSFGAAVGEYVQGRPGYPADALAWALGTAPLDVADVGAGTGKLTAGLVRHGHRVVAIDPDAAMLAQLASELPGVPTHVGTAERLPLGDSSVDAVTFGQAWHWVDVGRASRAAARVLRPGGTLALLWNMRDVTEPWVARLAAVTRGSKAEDTIAAGDVAVAAPFGPLAHATFPWVRTMTAGAITSMVRSRSLYIAGDAAYKEAVDADLDEFLRSLPELSGGGSVGLPYVTHVFKATLAAHVEAEGA